MKENMHNTIKKYAAPFITFLVLMFVGILLSTGFGATTSAQSEEELRSTAQTIQEQIDENLERVSELEEQASSLSARIEQLDIEVEVANQQIALINAKISDIEVEVAEAQQELDRQNDLLANSIRVLYKRGQVSTIELIAGSDSFGDYINEQEYLSQIKVSIADSAQKVEKLKETLEDKQLEQELLLGEQEGQKDIAERKQAEQEDILTQTEGEQAQYEELVEDLEAQRAAAQTALNDFLQSQTFVSLGEVKRGDNIGLVGSTGFSTGPHLHLQLSTNGISQNPVVGAEALFDNFDWPLPRSGWGNITQGYGCVAPPGFYGTSCAGGSGSFHSGLDVSGWYGDPVVAMADGDIIFRGWMGGFGNTVIIDHGNGVTTQYAHLNE